MANVIQWQGVSYNNKPYPGWAEFLGWLMALSSMVLIPAFAIYQLWKTPGTVTEVRIPFLNSHVVVCLSYQTWCRLTFGILGSPPLAIYVLAERLLVGGAAKVFWLRNVWKFRQNLTRFVKASLKTSLSVRAAILVSNVPSLAWR